MVTITDPLARRQRKRRVARFLVLATSEATVIPTFNLTQEQHLVPNAQVDVEAWDSPVARLP